MVRSAAQASGVLPKGVLNPIFLSQTNVASDFRAPYSEQFSLGIQYQLPANSVLDLSYVGGRGYNFQTEN